jgi:hydrogenase maturation factor
MLGACEDIHCMRDATRGGVATVLHTSFGGQQIVDILVGEQLPRIC